MSHDQKVSSFRGSDIFGTQRVNNSTADFGGSTSGGNLKGGWIALEPPWKGTLLNSSIRGICPAHFLVIGEYVSVLIDVVFVGQVIGGRSDVEN